MKKTFLILAFSLFAFCAKAQNVYHPAVYPLQQTSAGTAHLTKIGNQYVIGNDLLNASFELRDGKLYFGGCPEMCLQPGTELFQIVLGSTGNIVRNASDLTLDEVWMEDLEGRADAVKGSEHFPGKALCARFQHGTSAVILWRAVLRDGSHYLRTEMEVTPLEGKNLRFHHLIPMTYAVDTEAAGSVPVSVGNTRGKVLLSDCIFAGLETPMAYNTSSADRVDDGYETLATFADSWVASDWLKAEQSQVPARVQEVGFQYPDVMLKEHPINLEQPGLLTVEFQYASGSHRMNLCGVDIVDALGNVVASDYHVGFSGNAQENNIYQFEVPNAGSFTLRYWGEQRTESITSSGRIAITLKKAKNVGQDDKRIVYLQGLWSRNTTLQSGETWKVSAVVGLVGDENPRRSFLAYSERERAVPWRPYPVYISWYELNIDRNNAAPGSEHTNMNAAQVLDVISHWRTDFFDKYGEAPQAFVIDDGWDNYGPWTFHSGFPNEMRDMASAASDMGAGVGAWLGPVGGYGQSGNYRRAYWNQNNRGGMVLSNPAYYKAFKESATNLVLNQGTTAGVDDNSYRFFKFDGISDDFSATGPDRDLQEDIANENAEGIIRLERFVREELKEDIFFNTTVGTWASPFWYHYTDATWRQENDFGKIGNNSIDRENWITYRDRLVYQNYVTRSPICPINTIMTHGFILSSHGAVSKDMSYEAVLRELRCAFVCGSGLVELYNDYELMNSIAGGKLWADLAECIQWQRRNADVLPDAHWVGGNPWDGSRANVYGWASWNGTHCTLALRNGASTSQRYTFTLREALEIPSHITGSITLSKAFRVQNTLIGLPLDTPVDIDRTLSVTLPASSVFAFDGVDNNADAIVSPSAPMSPTSRMHTGIYDIQGRRMPEGPLPSGVYIVNGRKTLR